MTPRCGPALALAPVFLLQAAAPGVPARLAALEAVLDRHYRGETLEAAQARVNALVDAHNAQVDQRNQALEADRAETDREQAPLKQLEATLEADDRALAQAPDPADRDALRRRNQRVEAHNALVGQYNDLLATVRRNLDARNARMERLDAGLERSRAALETERAALSARRDAEEAFTTQGRDVAFFTAVNQLLADLRTASRVQPDGDTLAALRKVRGYRQELAAWAAAHQAAQPNGLVLVAALVGDEPCCFIVDTGAQMVCLPEELIEALGLTGSLGKEITHTLAGGQKARGRSVTFPRVAAAGRVAADVAGSVLPVSEVGIDGLLGQSFLKRFVYTIDETRPGKLILVER